MEFRKIALPTAIAAALLTSACGGGGSSSTTPTPVSNPKTLSGVVAKGVVRQGLLTAYESIGGAWVLRGTARTDAAGQYSVELLDYVGGPLKVLATADGATKMKCDVEKCGDAAFGSEVALSKNFAMETIIPGHVTTPVPVSPYTNMVAAYLESLNGNKGGVTKEQIEAAAATFSQLTGFPVLKTAVPDVTDSSKFAAGTSEQKLAGLLGAAILKMAIDNKQDVTAVLSDLAKAYADGSLDGDAAIIKRLLDSWAAIASDAKLSALLASNSAVQGLLKSQIEAISALCTKNQCNLDPQEKDKADLAKAKTLARNSSGFIDKLINTNFDEPLDSLGKDLSDAFFDRNATGITQVMGAVLDGVVSAMVDDKEFKDELFDMRDAIRADINSTASVTRKIEIEDDGELLGTLVVVADYSQATKDNPRTFQMSIKGDLTGTNTDGRTVNVDLALKGDFDLAVLADTTVAKKVLTMVVTGAVKDAITAMTITGGDFKARVSGPVNESSNISVLTSLELSDLTMTLKGPKGDFAGKGGFKMVSNADALLSSYLYKGKPKLSLAQITLDGGLTTTDGKKIKAKTTLDVTNADQMDLMAFLNSEEVIDFKLSSALTDAQALALRKSSKVAAATGAWTLGYAINTETGVTSTSFKDGANDTQVNQDVYTDLAAQFEPVAGIKAQLQSLPNANVKEARVFIKGNGDTITSSTLKGKVDLGSYETDSTFFKAELTGTFEFAGVEGLPAQMTAWVKRDRLNGGAANIQALWNGEWYNYSLTDADVKKNLGSLTVTDVYDTKLQLDKISYDDRIGSGAIYVGSKKMADITTNKGVVDVTYSDGSSERLQ